MIVVSVCEYIEVISFSMAMFCNLRVLFVTWSFTVDFGEEGEEF